MNPLFYFGRGKPKTLCLWGGLYRLAGDVILQLLDDFALSRYDLPYEIADRNDANDLPLLDHRQMTNSLERDGSQALLDRVFRRYEDRRARHDVPDPRVL